jgi:hypothetical protein
MPGTNEIYSMCTFYIMNHASFLINSSALPEFLSHKTEVPRMDTLVTLPNIPPKIPNGMTCAAFIAITSDNKYVVLLTPATFQIATNYPSIQI